jgi:hypothetical protein
MESMIGNYMDPYFSTWLLDNTTPDGKFKLELIPRGTGGGDGQVADVLINGQSVMDPNTGIVNIDLAKYVASNAGLFSVGPRPATGEPNKIYIEPIGNGQARSYVWVNGAWDTLGDFTSVTDLSSYMTRTETTTLGSQVLANAKTYTDDAIAAQRTIRDAQINGDISMLENSLVQYITIRPGTTPGTILYSTNLLSNPVEVAIPGIPSGGYVAPVNADWNATQGLAQILNKPSLFSGNYNDLSNRPNLSNYLQATSLAGVATSGNYSDLKGTPDLTVYALRSSITRVATTGAYSDLTGTPDLSVYALTTNLKPVATSGSYNDLIDKPVIPTLPAILVRAIEAGSNITVDNTDPNNPKISANVTGMQYKGAMTTWTAPATPATGDFYVVTSPGIAFYIYNGTTWDNVPFPSQVQASWTETNSSSPAYIVNKPTLAAVATTGAYNSLTGRPDLTAYATVASLKPVATSGSYADLSNLPNLGLYALTSSLKTVATTGDYNDLINKPISTQPDWGTTDPTSPSYIQNKPTIVNPVQPDWNQTTNTALDFIKNKPTIPTLAQPDWNATDTTSFAYIKNKPAITPMPIGGWSLSNLSTDIQDAIKKAQSAYQLPSTGFPLASLSQNVQDILNKANSLPGIVDGLPAVGSQNLISSSAVAIALNGKQDIIQANNNTETVLVGMAPSAPSGNVTKYGMSDVVSAVMSSNQFQTTVQTITAQTVSGTTPALDTSNPTTVVGGTTNLLAPTWTATGNGGIMVSTNSTTAGAATVTVNGVQVWSNTGTTAGNTGIVYVKQGDVVGGTGLTTATYAPLMASVAPAGTLSDKTTVNGKLLSSNPTLTPSDIGITSYVAQETDPTVPAWAKAQTKPTYTAGEVGALSAGTLYAGAATAGGAAKSVQGVLTLQTNGANAATFNGSTNVNFNVTPASIGAIDTTTFNTTLGQYVKKPTTAIPVGNLTMVDANGNIVDAGISPTNIGVSQPVQLPGSTVSFVNWVNTNLANRATLGITTGSPVYMVMRQVPTGILTADQAVGCVGRLTFVGLNPGNVSIGDVTFCRIQGNYITRTNVLSGAGANGYETLSLVEGLFAKDAANNEYMVFRITTNESDGNISFAGKSINKFVESNAIECLSQSQFSTKYTVLKDSNTIGEDWSYNVGYEQVTGYYWTTADGKRFRIYRATYRASVTAAGATAPFERQWMTLNNVYLFLGFDGKCSMIQAVYNGINYYFQINYYDAFDTLAISTSANIQGTTLRASSKVNPKDGNYQMWNISNNNALFTFYYVKSNDVL